MGRRGRPLSPGHRHPQLHGGGWFKLGQALNHLGRPKEARQALQEAVASYRTAPWYRRSEDRPWYGRARRLLRSLR